jgi:hypothetical protein
MKDAKGMKVGKESVGFKVADKKDVKSRTGMRGILEVKTLKDLNDMKTVEGRK